MLAVFSSIILVDTKIIYGYDFIAQNSLHLKLEMVRTLMMAHIQVLRSTLVNLLVVY